VNPNGVVADMMGGNPGDMTVTCTPACANPTPYCNPSRVCVPCLTDMHCPSGQVCRVVGQSSACVPGCSDDGRCGGGTRKCCAGACVDTGVDTQNCGACGNACGVQHSSASCNAGVCAPGKCSAGWADCNGDPKDGCEAKLDYDVNNCGACGMKCAIPHATSGCGPSQMGMSGCYLSACNYGYDDCNGDAKDGCETSTTSDVKNCGGCGMVCPAAAHASIACLNAVCALTMCNVGWGDCDNNAKNGCETPLSNDKNNCGKCGSACGQGQICINGGCTCANCMITNAKTKCVNNMCVFDQCVQGFADCNNNLNDGCEADLNNDTSNCSACGMACQQNWTCSAGVCSAIRPNVMLCGGSGRSPSVFFPQGMKFNLVNSCSPDNQTQAMFVTRNWGNGINANTLQTYLTGGGIVLTEYNISHLVWNLAFGTNTGMGARNGACHDTFPAAFQFSANDKYWQDNQWQQMNLGDTGCGYSVNNYPGITLLSGWDANNAAVGYANLGQGRFYATDFDWQDGENFPYQYTITMMGYMMTHRR
jgi:Cys-rich repeat protein